MTTTAEIATVPQINVIKGLSNAIWGSEWIVLDEYGDSEGVVDHDIAARLITALQALKQSPIDFGSDEAKLDALTKALAGDSLDEFRVVAPKEPEPAPVEKLIDDILDVGPPIAAPAWERFEIADSADVVDSEPKVRAVKPFTGRHGTRRAFNYHEKLHEPPCDVCRAIAIPVAPKPGGQMREINHGTLTGYSAHKRLGEDPCDECLAGARATWKKARGKTRAPGARSKAPKPVKKRQPRLEPRATSARSTARPVEGSANGFRPLDQLPEALFILLPNPDEVFTEEAKKRWLAFATLTLDVVWPNS